LVAIAAWITALRPTEVSPRGLLARLRAALRGE
jgi:hypothetical protein